MTREEAKEVFLNRGYVEVDGGRIFDADKWRQSYAVISEWLIEQEPCSDAISRQKALLSLTGEDLPKDRDKYIALVNERIKALSSVSPQEPKTGHWIYTRDYMIIGGWFDCSECGKRVEMKSRYCPDCGARME